MKHPIAICGYACRLPGACNPQEFWDLLHAGGDAVSWVSQDRFATDRFYSPDLAQTGKSYTFAAGMLNDIWGFDPAFFGISYREALQMDPQQRLIIQVAWEALEHAGLPPSALNRSRTGVYIGASGFDHANTFAEDPARIDSGFMLGNTLSIVANRLSYLFDFSGPSFTIDTACSSSFYALDQARRALQSGEIDTAIVGGVNVLLSPGPFVGFARAGMLSPDGRCKAFEDSANGYVRAEGAVVFVLRNAELAAENGDRERGRLLATDINTDGRTTGVAMPSVDGQSSLLRRIKTSAGFDLNDLAFVEAHGTGTQVGDYVEATSIGSVYGKGRRDPLLIGSVKTNIGHLEPASGLAGLLKAQLALEHGYAPRSLHVETLNSKVDFEALNLNVATEGADIPKRDAPWLAGINSFGFGGANGHAVISAPENGPPDAVAGHQEFAPLILSAPTRESLNDHVRNWRDLMLAADDGAAAELINNAAYRRENSAHTVIVSAKNAETAADALTDLVEGRSNTACATGLRPASGGDTAFVFSGNGAQWPGMGQGLYAHDSDFRAAFDKVSQLFLAQSGPDLADLLFDEAIDEKLSQASVAQPLIFAIQVALVQALAARGVRPDAVAGHSIGEVAAAWASGALTITDAVTLIRTRSLALETLHGQGGMAAVLSGVDDLSGALDDFRDQLGEGEYISVAADNNPRSSTISGPTNALKRFGVFARKRRLAVKQLDIAYPYHSEAVEPLRNQMLGELASLAPAATHTRFVSSALGVPVEGENLDAEYWWRNTRGLVNFQGAVVALANVGCRCFIEIGPRPVLKNYVMESATQAGATVRYAETMNNTRLKPTDMDHIAAQVVAIGANVDAEKYFGPRLPYRRELPQTPMQPVQVRAASTEAALDLGGVNTPPHPLLGWDENASGLFWRNHLSVKHRPWLGDHNVGGAPVLPGAAYVEIALAVGATQFPDKPLEVSGLDILAPISLDKTVETRVAYDRHTAQVLIESRPYLAGADWNLNARARIRPDPLGGREHLALDQTPNLINVDLVHLYQEFTARGLNYGPAFRLADSIEIDGDNRAVISLSSGANSAACFLDPCVLDSAMHGLLAVLKRRPPVTDQSYLPVRFGRVRLFRPGTAIEYAEVRVRRATVRDVQSEVDLFDGDGRIVATVSDLRLRATPDANAAPSTPRFWRQTERRLSGPSGAPSKWSDPQKQIIGLGVCSIEPVEQDDGPLLIDAICRRAVRDLIASYADAEGRLDNDAISGFAPNAKPLLRRMLDALSEDEQFAFDDDADLTGVVAKDCSYPPVLPMLAQLQLAAPQYGQEVLAVAGLPDSLEDALLNGLSSDDNLKPDGRAEHVSMVQWGAIGTLLEDLIPSWRETERLNILMIGATPDDLSRKILEHSSLTELTLTDAFEGAAEVMQRRAAEHRLLRIVGLEDAIETPDGYDVVIIADRLHEIKPSQLKRLSGRLAPGGPLIATQPMPDLLSDLLAGQCESWWATAASATMGAGKRRDIAASATQLSEAGYAGIEAGWINTNTVDAGVIVGLGAVAGSGGGCAVEVTEATSPNFVIFCASDGPPDFAEELRSAFNRNGHEKVKRSRLSPPLEIPQEPWEAVIVLAGPDPSADNLSDWLAQSIAEVKALLAALPAPKRLWLLVDADQSRTAAIGGLRRVLVNERPEIDARLISSAHSDARLVAREILNPSAEAELRFHAKGASAPRVEPVTLKPQQKFGARRLDVQRQGALENLEWKGVERRPPEAGEVEIAVRAAGLNFRDVMWAQCLLPEEALENGFAGPTLGMECSGVVVSVGEGVSFQEGERVIAFAPHALSSHVTIAAETVARMPKQLCFEAAATLPTIFATAQYALVDCARTEAGEWVLIHGGAGGVGLAAIQIAKALGARIIATAGSPARRRSLTALGVDHCLDSRSLCFADDVMALTEGRGVDVVINSLAGEAMERSVDCLTSFGRFVELGKRDFFADTRLGLRPFRRNLSYYGVDLDQLLADKPDRAQAIFAKISSSFDNGVYSPPPYQVFEAGDVVSAFRMMQKSGHIGKIVINTPAVATELVTEVPPHQFTTQGGWLIAGGLSGFGMATAERLAQRGAQKLWLVSKSGKASPSDAKRLARLIESGVAVETAALDICDLQAVNRFVNRIRSDSVGLTGAVHSAMALRDKPLSDLSDEDIEAVVAPKVKGAVNLDQATRNLGLEHFIIYTSAVVLFGNPHQAPYVAANAALEQIARDRVSAGETAFSIGWGAIGDSGYLTREVQARAMLETMLEGAFISESEALDGLEQQLCSPPGADIAVIFARLPWSRLARDLPIVSSPLFERLRSQRDAGRDAAAGAEIRAEIAAMSPREALKRVLELLREETANVLYQPVSEIDPIRPLSEIGFDSLMAVELRMSIEDKIGLSLPLLSLADATTLTDVAAKVVHMIQNGEDGEDDDALGGLIASHASEEEKQQIEAQQEIRSRADTLKSLA